jgi:hypothetical protein
MIKKNKTNKNKYIIFDIGGGHGKCIQATAVIRAIKKKYGEDREIVVVASWDAPFFYNADIYRFYTYNQVLNGIYFSDDYLNEDTLIFKHDPYNETSHILRQKHLTETWCDIYNITYDGYKPDIYLNPRELEIAKDKIKPDGRPIMLLQSHGGGGNQYSKKSWYRDIPIETAQYIVDYFKKDYRILHIKSPEQPNLKNTELLSLPHRELYAAFPLSTKRLFMDSFSQHLAAGLGLQSTVLWIGNSPKVFGYDEHINVLPNAKIINQFNKYKALNADITGFVQEFPYDTVNIFNVDEIIDAIKNQK